MVAKTISGNGLLKFPFVAKTALVNCKKSTITDKHRCKKIHPIAIEFSVTQPYKTSSLNRTERYVEKTQPNL